MIKIDKTAIFTISKKLAKIYNNLLNKCRIQQKPPARAVSEVADISKSGNFSVFLVDNGMTENNVCLNPKSVL